MDVNWIDTSGVQVTYATLAPGDSVDQGTTTGHIWAFVSESGEALKYFEAAADCLAVYEELDAANWEDWEVPALWYMYDSDCATFVDSAGEFSYHFYPYAGIFYLDWSASGPYTLDDGSTLPDITYF